MIKRSSLISARGSRTQEEIAKLCGVKQQTYSHWEMGRATPSIRKMMILERVLGVPKETLFCDVFNSGNEYKQPDQPTGTEGIGRISQTGKVTAVTATTTRRSRIQHPRHRS